MEVIDLIYCLESNGYEIENKDSNEPFIDINETRIIFNLETKKYRIDLLRVLCYNLKSKELLFC